VPRHSHSGLADSHVEDNYIRATTIRPTLKRKNKTAVGLRNPGNWCYANSSLQALFATPDFSDELATASWVDMYKVPRKAGEAIDQPQLMAKMMANLFHWMQNGRFAVMEAKAFMVRWSSK
jgi:ubiquitin carboxyl-terminal hydrolase 8